MEGMITEVMHEVIESLQVVTSQYTEIGGTLDPSSNPLANTQGTVLMSDRGQQSIEDLKWQVKHHLSQISNI